MQEYGLALHTSSPALGLGIGRGDSVRCQTWDLGRETSNYLHPHLQSFLTPQTWKDIGWIAVANGPGGFTGTRLGVVTARTIAQQLDLPLFAISSLAAVAWQHREVGRVAVSMPAGRGEVFGAVYELNASADGLITVFPDTVLPAADWDAQVADFHPILHSVILQSANLSDTVNHVFELAQLAYTQGQRPEWSSVLPFYGQHPVVMNK